MSDSEYSSEDDEDYVPEAESDSDDDAVQEENESKVSKHKVTKNKAKRKRKGGIKLDDDEEEDLEVNEEEEEEDIDLAEAEERARQKKEKEEAEKRARVEDLWASFKKDTKSVRPKSTANATKVSSDSSKPFSSTSGCTSRSTKPASHVTSESKVTITRTFDFAGEAVTVTKTVDADSSEAKIAQKEKEETSHNKPATSTPSTTAVFSGAKRKGGLGSLLGQIGKKPKISTLEKSKLDWDSFKAEEGIEDELKNFNKDGYLEKQDFLQRTDVRLFEREKAVRQGMRRK